MPANNRAPEKDLPRRLYRSEKNRIIAGVAGGLGEYFGIDPTIVRILFVILTVFGGSGILLYLLLWVVIPSESDVTKADDHIKKNVEEIKHRAERFAGEVKDTVRRHEENPQAREDSKLWLGVLILALGLFFLVSNFGWLAGLNLGKLWPIILIIFGLSILVRR